MIKVNVLYPGGKDTKFDATYYFEKHLPLVQRKVGAALRKVDGELGLSGGAPGSEPPFVALCHLYFDSVESFQTHFGPHAPEIMADIPNYTNVQPILQISEVKL
ncbi:MULTISPECIES: EthD family reductase [Hydrocarboniphaga]|jgi:uncharacterized protein (TIGR02118 family)|uniref:EthD domain-containing protein n=1 Tax=Hydrocarboniphaga effusa AP103 TaxID=1172194 RepID=I8HXU4_9GAMM|nr:MULTISPECIES: EthD family reductase [Hydrocarboniphaga]EIT68261.1 hypothetical protein WQQ_34560 [Hydrocarboniphaga effusa AP103]MDZ4078751.1 EthD family reductase [Hydrocarboniphaga sp.]